MKILVTGANGYLGQGVVKCLCDMGAEVIATDYNSDQIDKRAYAIECNLFDIEDPMRFFGNPDVLLHMAWKDGFVHYSESHILDLPRHYSFIKKCADNGCSRICVMGSMHEIGFYEGSIDEKTPCNPLSLYGISKDALRKLVQQLCNSKSIPYEWLRGFYIVGNTEFGCSVFSKITAAVKAGKDTFPFTSGQNQFDFIDYGYFCAGVASAALQNKITGIINICSGKPEKLCDRVERFINENKYNIKLVYGEFPDRPYDSKAVWGDAKKLEMIMEHRSL